jgi:hypothetical protein
LLWNYLSTGEILSQLHPIQISSGRLNQKFSKFEYRVVKLLGVGVTLEVRLHGFDLDLLRSGFEDGLSEV